MSKKTKAWLMIAASLVLVGCLIFGGVMSVLNWDFTKLSTVTYETNEYTIDENYKNISIAVDTADVVFVPCDSATGAVVCYEQKHVNHSVAVENDTLVIDVVDTRKWYEHIGVFFGKPRITVYMPQGAYGALTINGSTGDVNIPKELHFESMDISQSTGDVTSGASASHGVKIKTSTGNIQVENLSAGALDLAVSTGKITVANAVCAGEVKIRVSTGKTSVTDLTCQSLTSHGNTGDIYLHNVLAAEKFSIERSTGRVRFDRADAAEIFVETDTGDVTGTLRSEKVFITNTDTGRVNVPKTITGGRCEITTSTGDIKIDITP